MSGSSAAESQGQLGSLVECQKHWQRMSELSAAGVRIVTQNVRNVTEDVRIVTQRVRIVSGESGSSEVSLSKAGKRCQERYLDPSQDCWKTAELIGGASGSLPVSVRIVTYERQDRYPGCQDRYR